MNILTREKQIEVIAALCDGLGVRAAARITGVNRGTVAALALKLGHGCAELHDRMMVGLRVSRWNWTSCGPLSARSKSALLRKDIDGEGRPVHIRWPRRFIPRDRLLPHGQA